MFGENGSRTVGKESRCVESGENGSRTVRKESRYLERMGVKRLGNRADVWREWE